jgi:hypothetical protein
MAYKPKGNFMKSGTGIIVAKRFDLGHFVHDLVVSSCVEHAVTNFTLKESESDFIETPVSFRTFVESKEHMSFPPLSERQYMLVDFMLGDDPDKMFSNLNTLAVVVWGKGSGKDSLCALILCYVCYILICMRSPQAYFSFPEGEYIDCVNVAPSGEKASTVFFEKIRQRLLLWRWLKDKFPVRSSGAFVSQVKANPGDPVVTITKDGIIFPKLIRLLSRNSDNESAEGLNTLIYIMDEASAFSDKSNSRNSSKVYRVLRSSCKTRFGNRGKGFIISYPREQNDFTMRMYRENLGNLHVYTDKAATWEVLPQGLRFNSGTFLFEGKEVPMELKEDFDKDPTESKMMYMAEPPEAEHGFIEYPEKIYDCVQVATRPIVVEEDYVKDEKICKRITSFASDLRPDRDYIVTVDLGHKSDSAALSVFHREDSGGKAVFVQDLVTGWIPDERNKRMVSFDNIKEYILQLASRINVIGCWFDQWQSISLRESLAAASIPAHEYFLDYSDYKTFKEMLYSKRYLLQPHELQINEMKHLIDKRTRVDHPTGGHNDYVDTIVGATKVFLMKYQSTKSSDEWGDVETISENLHMQDPWE